MHGLSCTRRCLQCTIVHTKIMYSCRRRALEQKYQLKRASARRYTKYREEPTLNVLCQLLHLIRYVLKQYLVSWSNIAFPCPSYMLRFERATCMCFCFGFGRAILGPSVTERKLCIGDYINLVPRSTLLL